MEKINSKLFILHEILESIESYARWQKKSKEREEKDIEAESIFPPKIIKSKKEWDKLIKEKEKREAGFYRKEFFGIDPSLALMTIQFLLEKGIIEELEIIQYEITSIVDREERNHWKFFPKDVEKEFGFFLIPPNLIGDGIYAWNYEIKTNKEKIEKEIALELKYWNKGERGYSQNWRTEKQTDFIIKSINKACEDFPLNGVKIPYEKTRAPYVDFMATLLDLERRKFLLL